MKFRMVDRILDYQPRRRIVGVKTVSFEEYQLKSAFAGPPALPETLLMEAIFQLGNWLIVLSSDFTKMGLLVRLDEVRFDDQPGPGQAVILQADVRSWRDDGIVFDGLAFVAGRQIAAGRGCLAVPADLADFHDPADLRVLFSEIFRKAEVGP